MCLVLHNPHVDTNYGQNVWCRLSGRVSHNKYWYLREHGLGKDPRIVVYLDLEQHSFPEQLQRREYYQSITKLDFHHPNRLFECPQSIVSSLLSLQLF